MNPTDIENLTQVQIIKLNNKKERAQRKKLEKTMGIIV